MSRRSKCSLGLRVSVVDNFFFDYKIYGNPPKRFQVVKRVMTDNRNGRRFPVRGCFICIDDRFTAERLRRFLRVIRSRRWRQARKEMIGLTLNFSRNKFGSALWVMSEMVTHQLQQRYNILRTKLESFPTPTSFAYSKSDSRARPFCTRMFRWLMSRCTQPATCTYFNAE